MNPGPAQELPQPAPSHHVPPAVGTPAPEFARPEQGLVLVDSLEAGRAFCKRWQQQLTWAFALDYTAADTRASKQLEMPRVGAGPAGNTLTSRN